jgi:hypothetical protein
MGILFDVRRPSAARSHHGRKKQKLAAWKNSLNIVSLQKDLDTALDCFYSLAKNTSVGLGQNSHGQVLT